MRRVFSRLVATLVLMSLLVPSTIILPTHSLAQDVLPEPNLSLQGLELHFDRADRTTSVSSWLQEAERGLGAVADWEEAQARERLTDRLARFLGRQLEGELPTVRTRDALAHLEALDYSYLYRSEDGSIALDSAGDPLLRGAAGATGDHAAWRSSIDARRTEFEDAWAIQARGAYDEILAQVDGEYRAAVAGRLSATLDEYVARAQREFERLSIQSEARLLRGRLGDTYSLRRKREDESAAALAASLVTSTEQELSDAHQLLRTNTRALVAELDIASLDAWEQDYKGAFQAGLDAWNHAEGHLLEERLGWETKSQEAYIEAEAAWDAAFADLDQARTAWLVSMQQLIEEGRAAWNALELTYDEKLSRSVSDLAAAAAEEQSKIRKEVEFYLGVHSQALGILALAEKNRAYLGEELENAQSALKSVVGSRVGELEAEVGFLESEYDYWNELASTYRATAESVAETISGLGAGYVADFAGGSINAWDRELARLDRQLELLSHQRDIAQAVVDYAEDRSSSRATEAQTAQRLSHAEAGYARAEAAYLEQIGALEEISDDLSDYQRLLAGVQEDLAIVTTDYQAKKEAYDSLWLSWIAQNTTTLQRALENLGDEIDDFYTSDRPALYADHFSASEASIRADIAYQAEAIIEELPDLAETGRLRDAVLAVAVLPDVEPHAEAKTPEELATEYLVAGLSLDHPILVELLESYGIATGLADGLDLPADARAKESEADRAAAWDTVSEAHGALVAAVSYEHDRLAETIAFLKRKEMTEEEYQEALEGPFGEVYAEYAPFARGRIAAHRAEVAAELSALLGRSDQDAETRTFRALDSIASAEEALTLFETLGATGQVPAYLAGVIREYLAAHVAPLGLEAVEERGSLGLELEATIEALELADETGASLAVAAQMYLALVGFGGGHDGDPEIAPRAIADRETVKRFLLGELASYVERRVRELGGDTPEARTSIAAQGLQAVGLPDDSFTRDEIESFLSTPSLFDSATDILTRHYVRLSAERLAVRDFAITVDRAVELSGDPERATDEVSAFRALLAQALDIMSEESWDEGSAETKAQHAAAALSARICRHRQAIAERGELKDALAAGSTGRQAYFASTVQPAKLALDEATAALTEARNSYTALLEGFETLSSTYAESRGSLDSLYAEYVDARRELQLAEELSGFASHGYALESQSPADVLTYRQAELERVARIRGIVAALDSDPDVVGPTDELYQNHATRQASLREAKSYLLYASEQFERQIGAAAAELNRIRSEMTGAAYDLFRLQEGLYFYPDFAALSADGADVTGLTLFDSTDPETFMGDVAAYFSFDGEDAEDTHRAAEQYSTDIVRWIAGVAANGGSGLLNDFGLAIHRERSGYVAHAPDAPAIPIEIEANQVYQAILDHSRIGSINTSSVRRLINRRAAEALGRIEVSPEKQLLYSYFKAMFLSGNLTLDTSFVGYDTSAIAREEARYRARRAYEFYNGRGKRWWRGRLRRRIRHLYEDLPNYRGSGPRGAIAGTIGSFESALVAFHVAQGAFDLLSGVSGGLVSEEALRSGLIALGDARGASAPGTEAPPWGVFTAARSEALDYVEGAFATLTNAERASTLQATQALLEEVSRDLAATDAAMARRLSVLAGNRALDQATYHYLASAPTLDETALRSVAEALFANPAFSPDSLLTSQLAAAESVVVFNHAGANERMWYLTEVLGELGSYSVSLGADDEVQRLSADRAELTSRRGNWEATIADLHQTGLREFGGAFAHLAQERMKWRGEFRADYLARSAMWDHKYQLFQAERRHWAEDATAVTVSGTSARIARQLGLSAESLIAGIEDIDIPALDLKPLSIDRVIARSLDGQLLTSLLDYADSLSGREAGRRPAIAASLPSVRSPSDAEGLALGMSADITDEIHAKAATVAALQLRDSLGQMAGRIDEQIDDANQAVERNLSVTLRSAGYSRSGSTYRRRAVIDESLLGGIERETHRIGAYRYFDAPTLFLVSDITASGLAGLSGTLVEARIEEAQEEMRTYLTLIFGRSKDQRGGAGAQGDAGVATLEELTARLDESLVTRLSVETARFARSAQYGKHKDTEGLFNLHVGYAPVMKESDPEKVRASGYGESGRIMEEFFRNEARLARGLATMETAWYDLRLYDDDKDNDGRSDGLVGAPTARGVAGIATSIAALATGNVWAAAMINLADDAAFSVADAASGRTSWQAAGASFGRQAAFGLATTATGGVFSGFENASGFWAGGLAGAQVGGSAIGDTALGSMVLAGGEGFVNNNISGAINAVEWNGTGILGLGYNGSTWADNVVGRDAWGGYISAAGQAGTSTYLGNQWGLETHGFSVSERAARLDSSAASGFAGAMVGESITAGFSGTATMNLANFSGIAKTLGWEAFYNEESGTWARHGLAELSIGPMGPQIQLGGGGLNVSASNWRRFAAATRDIREMRSIQQDLDLAAIRRDYLHGIADRAIAAEEAIFDGGSSEADNLLAQLASIRRGQSRSNVYAMFGARRDGFSEAALDESLLLSMEQGDLSLDEFMQSTVFDTQGAFAIAAALQQGGLVGVEDLFATKKAYAGREFEGSESLDTRTALFGEYLRLTMRDDVENAEALLGGGVFHTASQIARRMLDKGDELESVLGAVAGDIEAAGVLHSEMVALKEAMVSSDGRGANLSANNLRGALAELLYREAIVDAQADTVSVAGVAGTPESAFPAMLDATYTSALGHRVLTQAMIDAGVPGELYEFGLNKHDGGDYFSKDGRFVAVYDGELSFLPWNADKGLGMELRTTDGNGSLHQFRYYHNSPDAVDRFALAVLASGGFTVPGGTVVGATGPDLTGIGTGDHGHLHAEYLIDDRARDPASLGAQYREVSTYARHMSGLSPELREAPRERYLDLDVLAGVEAYSRSAEPGYFPDYMNHHTGYPFGNVEEYLGYLDYLYRGGARR